MLTSEPDCPEIYWNQNTYNKHLIKSSKYCNKKAKDLPNKCILNQILNLQRNALTDAEAADVFDDLIEKGVREDYIDDVIRGSESPDESLGDFINTQILKLRRYAASVTAIDLSIIVKAWKKMEIGCSSRKSYLDTNCQLLIWTQRV